MKRIFILAFLILTANGFAQKDKKGKVETKTDSVTLIKSENIGFVISPDYLGRAYDTYPQFIGGRSAEIDFINKTMKHPECIKCKGVTDGTGLRFVVNENGSISDITITKNFPDCKECDEEALRIVKSMPNWKPAQLNGKNIKLDWDYWIRFSFGK